MLSCGIRVQSLTRIKPEVLALGTWNFNIDHQEKSVSFMWTYQPVNLYEVRYVLGKQVFWRTRNTVWTGASALVRSWSSFVFVLD